MGKTKAHIRYKLKDGTRVPGSTTITSVLDKPALKYWANKIGLQGIDIKKFVDDKADIGTLGHEISIASLYPGAVVNTSDYTKNQIGLAENCAVSFFEWKKDKDIEVILTETPLVSERHRYGGTMDIYAKVNGKHELIDLKTGSGIYDEYFIQVASYRQLLNEHNYPVDRVRILNIPRVEDESFAEQTVVNTDKYWQVFLKCLEIYNLRKEIKKEVA